MKTGMRHIFVSPHIDDAVLSCFPLMHACLEQGMPVELWTIMAGIPSGDLPFSADAQALSIPDPVTYVEKRRTEDREVGEALGATIVHFDFPDAIYRTAPSGGPLYPAVHRVFHHLDLRDLYLANRIFEAMAPRIQSDDVVMAPSARCGHVDHVLTRLACEMLPASNLLYEEFPYTVQSQAVVPRTSRRSGYD